MFRCLPSSKAPLMLLNVRHCLLWQQFSRPVGLDAFGGWWPFYRDPIQEENSCLSDSYVTIYNSSKSYSYEVASSWGGSPQHEELHSRVTALRRLRPSHRGLPGTCYKHRTPTYLQPLNPCCIMFLLTNEQANKNQPPPQFFNGKLASFPTISPCRTRHPWRILEATVAAFYFRILLW